MNLEPNPNNVLVFDIGSAMVRSGFAGEGFPIINIPSAASNDNIDNAVQYSYGDQIMSPKFKSSELSKLIADNYSLEGGPILEKLLEWNFSKLSADLHDSNIKYSAIFSEPAHVRLSDGQSAAWKKTIAEASFDGLGLSHICVSTDASLAIFAHCIHTGVVVDFGWSCTRVVPVIEGYVIPEAIKIHPFGGYAFSRQLVGLLHDRNFDFVDQKDGLSQSKLDFLTQKASAEAFKYCCHFGSLTPDKVNIFKSEDGREIDVHEEMDALSDVFWDNVNNADGGKICESLTSLISESIAASPQQVRSKLWTSIVTSGGFSKIQGFVDELNRNLLSIPTKDVKKRVLFPMHPMNGGEFTVWTGGSILGSSPALQNFWISQEEWKENGESILFVKFK